jgi:hypothetical protein
MSVVSQAMPPGALGALYERLAGGEHSKALIGAISDHTAAAVSERMCPHCMGRLWPEGDGAYCQDCHTSWRPPTPPGTLWSASRNADGWR